MRELKIAQLNKSFSRYAVIVIISLVLICLYIASRYNYLLTHILIEFYAVFIAITVFALVWNSRKFSDNHYILFLGIAFLFVGIVDLLHTLSYKGMAIFTGFDANLPTQLWIVARYIESISLLIAPVFIYRRLRIGITFLLYEIVLVLVLLSIFYWRIFPACFIEGEGLTPFKIASEYIISLLLVCAIWYLYRNRNGIDYSVFKLLIATMVLTIAAEMAFTLYTDVYGLTNFIGHAFKLISFYLLYRAIVVSCLRNPYSLLFKNLQDSKLELQESRERLQRVFNATTDGIMVIDLEGIIVAVNQTLCVLSGYSRKSLIGKRFAELVMNTDENTLMSETRKIARRGTRGYTQCTLGKKDGTELAVEVRAGILHDNTGIISGYAVVVSDITERIMVEQQRNAIERKAQMENRLATVGRLASGMAHEINNPLTSVIGHAQLLLKQKIAAPLAEDLEAINIGANRVADIVKKLQVFAREQDSMRSMIDVNDTIETMFSMLESQLKMRNIHVIKKLEPELPEIFSIKGQLLQVFLNIVINAEQSMYDIRKKGNLNVSTYTGEDKVFVVFQDDGPGIASEDIDRVFDPFFTTRGIGRGMGLGLSISREIVIAMGGDIIVQSEPGQGTTVRVELPYKSPENAQESPHNKDSLIHEE